MATEKLTEEKVKQESSDTSDINKKCLEKQFVTLTGECVTNCPKGTYQFMLNYTCLNSCPDNYKVNNEQNRCIRVIFEEKVTTVEFKTEIVRDIVSYVNSTIVINSTTFVAVVLSSEEMNTESQIKRGISAIQFPDKGQKIKRYYNIPDEEELIILSVQSKNDSDIEEKTDIKINFANKIGAVIGKDIEIEVYDISGRKLDISECQEEIEVAKYIGDEEEKIDLESAKSYAEMGIDVFNASSEFFNDLCYEYDNTEGKDIIIEDRRNDIYQNVSFCKEGCSYEGVDYELMVAKCFCDAAVLQSEGKNSTNDYNDNQAQKDSNTFNSVVESFIKNWLSFNIDVIYCYNLVFNPRILKKNIGFFVMSGLLVFQISFLVIFFIRRLKPIKSYMLNFSNNQNKAFPPRKNEKKRYNTHKKVKFKNNDLVLEDIEDEGKKENLQEELKKNHKKKLNHNNMSKQRQSTQSVLVTDKYLEDEEDSKEENQNNETNLHKRGQSSKINNTFHSIDNRKKKHLTTKNKIVNPISNEITDEKIKYRNSSKKNLRLKTSKIQKGKIRIDDDINYIRATSGKELTTIRTKSEENSENINYSDEELHGMDFDEAKMYDKRSYIRMYWSFLVDSQVILGTFFTDNYLNLLIIKLSFFIITYQISLFLNTLFYTDEYISEAYHNEGVLDFFTGLPKAIYSFVATLIITNLLIMLSNSKDDLLKIIREKKKLQRLCKIHE